MAPSVMQMFFPVLKQLACWVLVGCRCRYWLSCELTASQCPGRVDPRGLVSSTSCLNSGGLEGAVLVLDGLDRRFA
jgi:hypothetical protein